MKTVRYSAGGSVRIEAVPLDAVPASLGLVSWLDTGDRHVAYRCIVTPRADGRWSGRSALVPAGWTIGSGSGDRRVCRYVADATAPARSMRTSSIRWTTSTSPARSWRRISWSCAATRPARPRAQAARVRGPGTLHISLTVRRTP
jgi:hypothetical protein